MRAIPPLDLGAILADHAIEPPAEGLRTPPIMDDPVLETSDEDSGEAVSMSLSSGVYGEEEQGLPADESESGLIGPAASGPVSEPAPEEPRPEVAVPKLEMRGL